MEDRVETSENIFRLILTIQKKLIRPVLQQTKSDISPLQFHILDTLRENATATMTMLANETRTSKQQLTRLVDKLVAQQIVERKFDCLDRRIIKISLTETGRQMLDSIKNEARDLVADKLESLNGQDRREINGAAVKLTGLLKKLS